MLASGVVRHPWPDCSHQGLPPFAPVCLQVGHGYRVMTVEEWSARWKKNEAWPECLQCGSKNTKEHHFTQVEGRVGVWVVWVGGWWWGVLLGEGGFSRGVGFGWVRLD